MFKKINLLAIFAILLMFVNSCTTEDLNNTVTDIDGNEYHTVTIGTQVWMVENLKTTRYRNGDVIPNVSSSVDWSNQTTGAYSNYNNNDANGNKYGRLYNGYAVSDSRNIAPAGWHVPTDEEWVVLKEYLAANLGTSGSVAKTMASNKDWASSTNERAIGNDLTKNNSSGFTAMPGGYRLDDGAFNPIGYVGFWWSSTGVLFSSTLEDEKLYVWGLDCDEEFMKEMGIPASYGYSVRCIRNSDKDETINIPGPDIYFTFKYPDNNILTVPALRGYSIWVEMATNNIPGVDVVGFLKSDATYKQYADNIVAANLVDCQLTVNGGNFNFAGVGSVKIVYKNVDSGKVYDLVVGAPENGIPEVIYFNDIRDTKEKVLDMICKDKVASMLVNIKGVTNCFAPGAVYSFKAKSVLSVKASSVFSGGNEL